MNKKTGQAIRKALMALFLLLCSSSTELKVYASDGQEYITISVDATDENGNLLYAIDTDDPSAFTSSNEFSVPAGTHHTIYVKDAAGNISSQEFSPVETNAQMNEGDTDNRTVNIDVTLNDTPEQAEYGYPGMSDPAESGQGTIYEKITTDATDQNAERIFYTITIDEGEVFYMVIDQGQSSNNVYLLDQVNLSDLKTLAADDSGETETEESSSLLSALSNDDQNTEINSKDTEISNISKKENTMMRNLIFLLIFAAAGGGYYYYKNIYKGKKDEQMDLMDALDKEDFVAEDESDEEADFGLDEDYQEQIMQQLIEDDEDDSDDNDAFHGGNDAVQEEIFAENLMNYMQEEKPYIFADTVSHENSENIEEDEDDEDEDLDEEEDE